MFTQTVSGKVIESPCWMAAVWITRVEHTWILAYVRSRLEYSASVFPMGSECLNKIEYMAHYFPGQTSIYALSEILVDKQRLQRPLKYIKFQCCWYHWFTFENIEWVFNYYPCHVELGPSKLCAVFSLFGSCQRHRIVVEHVLNIFYLCWARRLYHAVVRTKF